MISLSGFQPLSIVKLTLFIKNRGFTERYFTSKVYAILIEQVPVQTTLRDCANFRRLASLKGLKYLDQPSNFVLNILTTLTTLFNYAGHTQQKLVSTEVGRR